MKTLASDNYSGVHPEIMKALQEANVDHMSSYGADQITARVEGKFRELFGSDTQVLLVYNGTGANVIGLSAMTRSFNSIICSELAHINVDESTAPEKFTGCKLIGLPTRDGKIYPQQIEERIQRLGDQHHPQFKVISISQLTEYGTAYTESEIRSIAAVAKKYGFFLHVDGSRISNAAVSLKKDFKTFTSEAGVDILSFGGTKNGMMFGEAVLVFNKNLHENLLYLRKQGMQLHSKMRFISAQFDAFLTNDLWKRNATHSNAMAKRLEQGLRSIPQIRITQSVDGNGVFATIPKEIVAELQEEMFFYIWNEQLSEARLMCSFDTTIDEIERFIKKAKSLLMKVSA